MAKVDLKLAMENAQRSILESRMNRAMSKMTPEQQKMFMQKVMSEAPEVSVETPEAEKVPIA